MTILEHVTWHKIITIKKNTIFPVYISCYSSMAAVGFDAMKMVAPKRNTLQKQLLSTLLPPPEIITIC